MPARNFPHRLPVALLGCLLLAACGDDKTSGNAAAAGDDGLPKPGVVSGSVTGMPNPGAASAPPARDPAIPIGAGEDSTQASALETSPEIPDLAGQPMASSPEDEQQALGVLRMYYGAINAGDYAAAHALWSDRGRASGQSLEQFAQGFAGTEGVSVQFGAPGALEGAAGSRFIEVPATVEARQADGGVRRYAGRYTLRMSVVDGASAEQRSWHIASADLRELAP